MNVPWAMPDAIPLGHDAENRPITLIVTQLDGGGPPDAVIDVGTIPAAIHLYRIPPHLIEDLRAALLPLCPTERGDAA